MYHSSDSCGLRYPVSDKRWVYLKSTFNILDILVSDARLVVYINSTFNILDILVSDRRLVVYLISTFSVLDILGELTVTRFDSTMTRREGSDRPEQSINQT